MKCEANVTDKSPPNITPIEATTVSLASNPDNKETDDCQLPNPNGENIGAIN